LINNNNKQDTEFNGHAAIISNNIINNYNTRISNYHTTLQHHNAPLGKKYIMKACGGWGGKGTAIVESAADIMWNMRRHPKYQDWVLQKYLTNILLLDNRKFHIRFYLLIVRDHQKHHVKSYLYREGIIYLSSKDYSPESTDMGVHLSNASQGGNKFEFSKYFSSQYNKSKTELVYQRFKKIARKCTSAMAGDLRGYSRTKMSYEIFGVDVLVLQDFRPVILEFNCQLGWKKISAKWKHYFFDSILQTVVDPIYPPNKLPEYTNNLFEEL